MQSKYSLIRLAAIASLISIGCSSSSPDASADSTDGTDPETGAAGSASSEPGPSSHAGGASSASDAPGGTTAQDNAATAPEGVSVVRSALQRVENPDVPAADQEALNRGNTAFALDLYQSVRGQSEENLLFSPHSISIALAMTYAGARGETERQMAEALHFDLPQEQLHPAFNQLDARLASRAVRLDIVNATFGHQGYVFLDSYLDVLAENYGAPMYLLDFAQTEQARQSINSWVADQTEDKIEELIQAGVLTAVTRLVLTNAVYFKASWLTEFDPAATAPAPFTLADGSSVEVQMMHNQTELGYAEVGGWQAVELPYAGEELSFVALLPAAGSPELDLELDVTGLDSIISSLAVQEVALTMPRFSFGCPVDLKEHLQGLGMVDAFRVDDADLSGMDGTELLYVQAAVHEAFIEVNEEGTEAAAATAVVVGLRSAAPSPLQLTLDRPFVILIRDRETRAVLFLGRVADPR